MKFSTPVYLIVYDLRLHIIVVVCVNKELTTDHILSGVNMLKQYCHPFENNGHETNI